MKNEIGQVPHIECCNFGVAVLHNLLYILGGCFSQVTIVIMMLTMIIKAISSRRILSETCLHQGEGGVEETIHPFGFCYNPRLGKWSTTGQLVFRPTRTEPDCRDLQYKCRHDGAREMPVLFDGVRGEVVRDRGLQ